MLKRILTTTLLAGALSASALTAASAADRYVLDASHSQIVFSYNHLDFSTTFGMFSGFEGEAMLDMDDPANSSVNVSFPASSMITGWDARTQHFLSGDFLDQNTNPTISFTSTMVEPTGDNTAKVTGDLDLNGVVKPVTLDVTLNKMGMHPRANKPWAGFDATTTLLRSDFNMGAFAPFVGDEVELIISVEMFQAN